jgi:hypothetical protein
MDFDVLSIPRNPVDSPFSGGAMDSTYLLSIFAIVVIMFIAGGVYLFAQKRARDPGHGAHGARSTDGEGKAAQS